MKTVSPKEYIKTRARSLPVYKCLVNKDWQKNGMAHLMVMRRHSNGNVTFGNFLVDLLCLGVKDTLFRFNVPEEELQELTDQFEAGFFEEIDYTLAHNIVYAGHDFAMEFDIHPHADFAVTRYILEEDDDTIPLVEIHVGAEDGKPHLVENNPGQYTRALAKLKQHAGEGNYYHTTALAGSQREI